MRWKVKMKTYETRGKKRAKHRPGFTLTEVLVALLLMSVALVSVFGIISSALSATTEVRARMEDYSRLEHAGLLAVASGDVMTPPPAGIVSYATSCDVPITIGGDTKSASFTNVVYRYEQDEGKAQKMKSSVFVVFVSETP
jgi:prepilin-type N-terminal cleavage/methylation domain-containing protein